MFGPHEVGKRSELQEDKAIIKCEYSMAAFSTGMLAPRGRAGVGVGDGGWWGACEAQGVESAGEGGRRQGGGLRGGGWDMGWHGR